MSERIANSGVFSASPPASDFATAAGVAVWIAAVGGVVGFGHADPYISPLLLLAPCVQVPLALSPRSTRAWYSASRAAHLARRLQAPASVLLGLSYCLPLGVPAALCAAFWWLVGALWAVAALTRFREGIAPSLPSVALLLAAISLPIGGGWIVLSRGGVAPLGFAEPIVLLTAVHFHFSGFITATLLALTYPIVARGSRIRLAAARTIAVVSLASPALIAAGFVFSPTLKAVAVALFSTALFGLAALILTRRTQLAPASAEVSLQLAAFAIVLSMSVAAAYELGEFTGAYTIPIVIMVATHGVLNVLGFSLCGLLAFWLNDRVETKD